MLGLFAAQFNAAASRTAKTAALGLSAAIFLGIGFIFLTTALCLFLLTVTTPVVTFLILGMAYVGIGSIVFSVMQARNRAHQRRREAAAAAATAAVPATMAGGSGVVGLLVAFITGLTAARKARF